MARCTLLAISPAAIRACCLGHFVVIHSGPGRCLRENQLTHVVFRCVLQAQKVRKLRAKSPFPTGANKSRPTRTWTCQYSAHRLGRLCCVHVFGCCSWVSQYDGHAQLLS